MKKRTIGTLILAASLVAGCSGGSGGTVPHTNATPASRIKALAFVTIAWPTKTSTRASARNAKFISSGANRIEVVTNADSQNSLPTSDQTVEIPAGTGTAQIPAVLGDNYWYFTEYDGPTNASHILATARGYAYISDPTVPVTVDIIMSTSAASMGVKFTSTDAVTYASACSPGSPCTYTVVQIAGIAGTPAHIELLTGFPQSFTLYLQPTDLDNNLITGAGIPGISLTTVLSPDPDVAIARAASDPTGAFARYLKYTVTVVNTIRTCSVGSALNVNGIDPSTQRVVPINTIMVSGPSSTC